MFESLKNFFTPKHRHIETIPIYFDINVYPGFGMYRRRRHMVQYTAITCYLHTCPECGELLEYGKAAKLSGQKVGNFYTLRQSMRLSKLIWETMLKKKLLDLGGIETILRFDRDDLSCSFEEKKTKVIKKQAHNKINLAA